MRKKKQPTTNGISLLPFLEEFHAKAGTTDLYTMIDDALASLQQAGYIKQPRKQLSYGKFVIKDITPTGKPLPEKERDYEDLARKMIDLYPRGTQPNIGYPWRCSVARCIQRFNMLKADKYLGPIFTNCTDEELLRATRAYVADINDPRNKKRILGYFIIKQVKEGDKLVSSSELLDWVEMTADMTDEEMQQKVPAALEEADLL